MNFKNKTFLVTGAILGSLTLAGCSGHSGTTTTTKNSNSSASATVHHNNPINVKANGKTFPGYLAENDTAKQFGQLLPLTFKMENNTSEDNLQAKLSHSLSTTLHGPGTVKPGDIVLQGDKTVVMYYKTTQLQNYTLLAHLDSSDGLKDAVSADKDKVIISKQ
ncbi:MAG: cyclophilin-like fold protein [Micrococcaceae bacterium]